MRTDIVSTGKRDFIARAEHLLGITCNQKSPIRMEMDKRIMWEIPN
jgi:hypothetical protein